MANLRSHAFGASIAIAAAVVALACADLAARAAFAVRDAFRSEDARCRADAYAEWPFCERYFQELHASDVAEWRPYVQWRVHQFSGELINVDARGLRRTSNDASCGPSSTMVFVFGGSTVWGTGARDDFTIPSFLARILGDRRSNPVCVVNFGQPGYVSSQELIALTIELRDGARPALAIFYDGDNDAFAAMQTGAAGAPENEEHRRREFNLRTRPGDMFVLSIERLAARSGLYRLAQTVGEKLPRPVASAAGAASSDPNADDLAARVAALYIGNVHLIETLAQAYGFRALFYWQPLVFDKSHRTGYEAAEAARDASFARFWRRVRRAIKTAPPLAADGNFSDLGDLLADRRDPLFIDFAHVSEQGNALIAERIGRDAGPMLR